MVVTVVSGLISRVALAWMISRVPMTWKFLAKIWFLLVEHLVVILKFLSSEGCLLLIYCLGLNSAQPGAFSARLGVQEDAFVVIGLLTGRFCSPTVLTCLQSTGGTYV
jgi:hypothetical protein